MLVALSFGLALCCSAPDSSREFQGPPRAAAAAPPAEQAGGGAEFGTGELGGEPTRSEQVRSSRGPDTHAEVALSADAGAEGAPSSGASAESLSRVLLLGDSISIGYTPFVRELLGAEAVVVRPTLANGQPENCAGTNKGVECIERWLALEGGDWDVIHFNFGLHDLKRVQPESGRNSDDPEDPRQAEPERYETQLGFISAALAASGARLVFATTTPVPEGVHPHRDPEDVPRYNAIARRAVRAHVLAIDDLYEFALPRLQELQRPLDVHFGEAGSRALAEQVAASIRAALALESD